MNITRLHVRYEDDSAGAEELHSAVGLTMERLTVRTCDESWKQARTLAPPHPSPGPPSL